MVRPLRIAVFHNQPSGGARRALAGFCAHLGARHAIDVYALSTADDEWIADAALGRPMPRFTFALRRPIRGGLWLDEVRQELDRRDLGAVNRAVAATIDAGEYDVCLVDVCRFTLVPEVLRHLRLPSLYYAHNGPAVAEAGAWRPTHSRWEQVRDRIHGPAMRVRERALATAQRRALTAATVVAANSRHTAERVRRWWGRDAVVCPPGVEIPSAIGADRDESEVLSVGEVEPRKDFAFLVRALATLPPPRRPSLRICTHRADTRTEHELLQLASDLGVRVTLDHDPSAAELAMAYRRAALFVFAARNEALGLAPLEAMAHGCPVVAVGEGGVRETVVSGRTGVLTGRDPAAFGSAVRSLLEDRAHRDRLGSEARRTVETEWSWAVRGPQLEAQLDRVASGAHLRPAAR